MSIDSLKQLSSKFTQVVHTILQEFSEECNDVTRYLPKGASSIVVFKDSDAWQVFTELSFRGATANLESDRKYKSLEEMGLTGPVKSFRKAP